jgi:hypothetical protein
MEGSMKANGNKIICMVKVYTLGKMEENMREPISMIKSKALANIYGQMVVSMKVNG